MSINIELPAFEIAALKRATNRDCEAEAIIHAAREYLRVQGLSELKTASGKFEFDDNWQQMEQLELEEAGPPK